VTHDILRPDGWPRPKGYSDGIAARGAILVTAGQIGWDPVAGRIGTQDFAEQAAAALDNVLAVLNAGGALPADVVRLTWFVTDMEEYRAARAGLGRAFRERFQGHYPAMSVVQVAALLEAGAMVEIEAMAVVPDDRAPPPRPSHARPA
jgi:enamine deaminase RidA (YjgF/YER057c/UK114 family)